MLAGLFNSVEGSVLAKLTDESATDGARIGEEGLVIAISYQSVTDGDSYYLVFNTAVNSRHGKGAGKGEWSSTSQVTYLVDDDGGLQRLLYLGLLRR